MDIKKWFYIPNSGKMSIAEQLLMALRERGVTWPPNVAGFCECTTYKPGKSPSESTHSIQPSLTPSFELKRIQVACPPLRLVTRHTASANVETPVSLHFQAELQAPTHASLANLQTRYCTAISLSICLCADYGTGIAGMHGWAIAATPSAAVVDLNVGAHLAFVPQDLVDLGPETPCFLSGNECALLYVLSLPTHSHVTKPLCRAHIG